MWRSVRVEDVRRGVVLRMTSMHDTPFNGCIVIGTAQDPRYVRLARPMGYAHTEFDSRVPLLSAEVFDVSKERIAEEGSDFEVWENASGELLMASL